MMTLMVWRLKLLGEEKLNSWQLPINNKFKGIIEFLSLILLLPSYAYADVGIPMIFLSLYGMAIALIPVILIESLTYCKSLHVPFKRTIIPSLTANLLSTFVGFPLAWIMQFAIEFIIPRGGNAHGLETFWQKVYAVTIQSAWLIPYEGDLDWMIPIAAMVGLVPAFFITIYIELPILKRYLKESDSKLIKRSVWLGNILSYGFLISILLAMLLYTISKQIK